MLGLQARRGFPVGGRHIALANAFLQGALRSELRSVLLGNPCLLLLSLRMR